MYDLAAIGDIKLDTFVVLNDASVQCQLKMPDCQLCLSYGAKIAVNVVASQIAGTAPNVATGLSRMGRKTAVVSNMGSDGTHSLALETLKREKVASKFIQTIPGEQSAYAVVLNYKGEKTLLTSHIRHAYRFPQDLKTHWLLIGEMGHGYEALYRSVIARKRNNGVKIAFNPGTIQIAARRPIFFSLLRETEVLFVNVEETQAITGSKQTDPALLMRKLRDLGARTVIMTDGRKGSYAFDGTDLLRCEMFPGRRVEATGAGDAFATGFLGATLNKASLAEAIRWGSVNAASVVGKVGPTAGLLTVEEIRSRLKKHPKFGPVELKRA